MNKLTINNFYSVKGFELPLKFMGIEYGDFICDICHKSHYHRVLPKLYWFEISKDNHFKVGTTCIKKVINDKNIYTID